MPDHVIEYVNVYKLLEMKVQLNMSFFFFFLSLRDQYFQVLTQ